MTINVYEWETQLSDYRWVCPVDNSEGGFFFEDDYVSCPQKLPGYLRRARFRFHSIEKPAADNYSMSAARILSGRAVQALELLLLQNGELYPLTLENQPQSDPNKYYIFNCTRVVDALDQDQIVWRYPEEERLSDRGIRLYGFHFDAVKDETVFRIPMSLCQTSRVDPGEVDANVFVTDRFVEAVYDAGLVGFEFPLQWSGQGT